MLTKEITQKIESLFKNKFLGNSLLLNDEEKSILYEYVGDILRNISDSWGEDIRISDYRAVVVALVELTKEWNSDEDAWMDYIASRLLGRCSQIAGKRYNQICKCIDTLNSWDQMFVFKCFQKKYYTSICSHAFSPKKSTFSFLDMCWEIYCKDLFQQYDKNDEILNLIASSLNKKISNSKKDDEDIQLGSKVYGFRAGIKGLAIEKQDLLKELLDEAFETMNHLTNDEPIKVETYFASLIKEWWDAKASELGTQTRRDRTKHEFIASDPSQIKAKYALIDGCAKLHISSFRLIENFDYEPYIEIKVNGKQVKAGFIPTMGSGIILTAKSLEYDLDQFNFSGTLNIEVEITHCGKTIFHSKNSLKREFILFAGNRESNSQSLIPGTYFLYAPKIGNMTVPEDIQRAYGKNLYSVFAHEGEVIRSSERIIFFESERSDRNLYFYANERNDADYRQDGEIYKIIDGDVYLDTEPSLDISDIGLRLNERIVKLSTLSSFDFNGKRRFGVSYDLEFGKPIRISAFRYSDNHILASMTVIKFKNISITYDKEIYYGDNLIGNVIFKTERYRFENKIDVSLEENTMPFNEGEIILNPPVLRWKIDDREWQIKPSKAIYFKEITNSSLLDIDVPLGFDYIVALSHRANNLLERTSDGKHYKLGQTIYSTNETLIDETTLFVRLNDCFYELARIALKSKFLVDPITVDSNNFSISWKPDSFVGDKNLSSIKIKIISKEGSIDFEQALSLEASMTFHVDSLEEGYYDVQISGTSDGFLRKEEQLFKKEYLFGNLKSIRFKNKILKVNRAVTFEDTKNKAQIIQIRPFYISDIRFITEKDGFDVYSGNLFLYSSVSGKRSYTNMRDENNVWHRINPLKIELKTLASAYLGYGLDLDDPDLEYDGEFAVDYDGKTTISNRGARGVDFYLFEVLEEGR